MKKTYVLLVAKIITFCIVFVAALIFWGEVMNRGNTDMTARMQEASLPVVCMEQNGVRYNVLHGYTTQMESGYLHESITTIDSSRKLSVVIQKYGALVSGISYQIRSLDGSRLIEDTQITEYDTVDDEIRTVFPIKDLLEEGETYQLDIILITAEGTSVHYYTSLVMSDDYHVDEKMEFVTYFSNTTFDKEEALNITRYLESNSQGDNTTLGKVTIHSSFNQITWADLNVEQITEPVITIKEIAGDTGMIHMEYLVQVTTEEQDTYYRVKEYYRVRYTRDRMYLLDYEREMNQLFDERGDCYTAGTISLGIQSEQPVIAESESGNILAFTAENRLFCLNTSENNLALLYGFYDASNADVRTFYDANEIEILSVDETGNVRFMVYGYMNRGRHEGSVGIGVYYYSSLSNTVEEEVFIPYTKSFELLELEMKNLTYVSNSNELFLILDCNVYLIDLAERNYEIIASGIVESQYVVSTDQHLLLLQNGDDMYHCDSLTLINLNTQNATQINAGSGSYIMPIGFMGDDIIYGLAYRNDIVTDSSGLTLFPMYRIQIENTLGEVLKAYEQEGIYVTGGTINENQLVLTRVVKTGEDTYSLTDPDQILNSEVPKTGNNTVTTPVTQTYEKITQLNLTKSITVRSLKHLTPREVIFEGTKTVALESEVEIPKRYYVYGLQGAVGMYTKASDAVNLAQEIAGVVLGDEGQYIWARGTRSSINQIMAIEAAAATEEKSSLAVCLDTILSLEGVIRNTDLMLEAGLNAIGILYDNLPDATILDLSGCSLESILYYVNLDIPVLALLDDGEAILIIGYNTTQVALMNPNTGTIYKRSMTDAGEWFTENGNVFITYVR